MDTKLLPAFMCNIASRVVWLRQAIEQDPELKKVAHKLARFTAPMSFEKELLSGKMDQVQKVVDEITGLPEPREMSATFSRAPDTTTLDFVSELRQILSKPGSGVEAAQRIENWVHEVLLSHTEGENPTLQFVSADHPLKCLCGEVQSRKDCPIHCEEERGR